MKFLLTYILVSLLVACACAQMPERIPAPTGSTNIEFIAEGTRIFYACAFDAVYRTESVNQPWTRCAEFQNAIRITPLYAASDSIIVSVSELENAVVKRRLYASFDKGASWTQQHEVNGSWEVAGYANHTVLYADTCDYYGTPLTLTAVASNGQILNVFNTEFPCENYTYSWAASQDSMWVSAAGVVTFLVTGVSSSADAWLLKPVPNVVNVFNTGNGSIGFLFDSVVSVVNGNAKTDFTLPFKVSELGLMKDFVVVNDTAFFPFKNGIIRLPKNKPYNFIVNLGRTPATRCYGVANDSELIVFLTGPSLSLCNRSTGALAAWNNGLFAAGGKNLVKAGDVLVHGSDWNGLTPAISTWNADATKPLSINQWANSVSANSIASVNDAVWLLGDGAWTLNMETGAIASQIESSRLVYKVQHDGFRTYLWRSDAVLRRVDGGSTWESVPISGDYFDMVVRHDSINMLRFEFGPAPMQVQIVNTIFNPDGFPLAELRVVTSDIADGRYLGTTITKNGLLVNLGTSLKKSTDGGLTWLDVFTPFTFSGSITQSDSVLCVWCSDQSQRGVCISGNGGNTWVMQPVQIHPDSETLLTNASDKYFTFSTWNGVFRVPRTVTSVRELYAPSSDNSGVLPNSFTELVVVDVAGRLIFQSSTNFTDLEIKSYFAPGFYLVCRRYEHCTISSLLF